MKLNAISSTKMMFVVLQSERVDDVFSKYQTTVTYLSLEKRKVRINMILIQKSSLISSHRLTSHYGLQTWPSWTHKHSMLVLRATFSVLFVKYTFSSLTSVMFTESLCACVSTDQSIRLCQIATLHSGTLSPVFATTNH